MADQKFRRSHLGSVKERVPPGHTGPFPPIVRPESPSRVLLTFEKSKYNSIPGVNLTGVDDPLTYDAVAEYYYKCTNSKDTHYFSSNKYLEWCELSKRSRRCPIDFSKMDLNLYKQSEQ